MHKNVRFANDHCIFMAFWPLYLPTSKKNYFYVCLYVHVSRRLIFHASDKTYSIQKSLCCNKWENFQACCKSLLLFLFCLFLILIKDTSQTQEALCELKSCPCAFGSSSDDNHRSQWYIGGLAMVINKALLLF